MATSQPEQLKRILSLDGGGVRGLSTILILKRLMRLYNEGSGEADEKHPWEVFDMICGTSTGGIIAIMLGRLQMSLEECEDAYLRLSEKIFSPRRSKANPLRGIDYFQAHSKFDYRVLEEAIRSELKSVAERRNTAIALTNELVSGTAESSLQNSVDNGPKPQEVKKGKLFSKFIKKMNKIPESGSSNVEDKDENIVLWNPEGRCKVFVCTVREKSTRPTALRSYAAEDNMEHIYKICKVWEAVRATSAATTFFDPIQIGKYSETFVDGGVKENNPVARAKNEASKLWQGQKLVITSVGTGTTRIESFEGNLITLAKRLKEIATDCEEKWESFVAANQDMRKEGCLFRFTASGLEDVLLDEAGKKNLIADRTNSYLENGVTKEQLEKCRRSLLGQSVPVKEIELSRNAFDEISNIPFNRNANFVGREDIIHQVKEKLSATGYCQRVALWGLGGAGKTQIALEIAFQEATDRSRRHVFWIPAISVDTFEKAYFDIGKRLKISGILDKNADVKALVKKRLSDETFGEWLIIVDNADNVEVLFKARPGAKRLFDFLPDNSKGSILFTTRTRKAAVNLVQTNGNMIEVPGMSRVEAEDLLKTILGANAVVQDKESADKLITILAYLPLAIVQAASYISSNDIPLSTYISIFEKSETNTIHMLSENFETGHRYPDQEKKNPIAATWLISFEQIQKEDPLAASYLTFMACTLRENIPQSILPPSESEISQTKAIGTLTAYSFVTKQENPQKFDMHRLVHLVTRKWLQDQNRLGTQTNITLSRISEVLPYGGHENYKIWAEYIPHATYIVNSSEEFVEFEERAELLEKIGRCQKSLGLFEASEKSLRKLLELYESHLGKEDLRTLIVMSSLGTSICDQGKYTEAEAVYRNTLVLFKKISRQEDLDALSTKKNLGYALLSQRKYTDAETILREALASLEKLSGPERISTLGAKNFLAHAISGQGNEVEAEKIYREVLAQHVKILGMEHPRTLTSKNNLANSLYNQKKYSEAESIYRETLAQRENVSGKERPETLVLRNNFAAALTSQGKYSEAESIQRETLALREKVSGLENSETLLVKYGLAIILEWQMKYAEAKVLYQETLVLREKVLGKEHFETKETRKRLSVVQHKISELDER